MEFVQGEDLKPEWVRRAIGAACSSTPNDEVLTVSDLAWNVVDPNFYKSIPVFVDVDEFRRYQESALSRIRKGNGTDLDHVVAFLCPLCDFSADLPEDADKEIVGLLDLPIEFDKPEKVFEVVFNCLKKFAEKK